MRFIDPKGLYNIEGMQTEADFFNGLLKPLLEDFLDFCKVDYCTNVSKKISIVSDVISISATTSVVISGGITTPGASIAGVTAQVISAINGVVSLQICGPSKSSVTTAAGLIAKGKTSIIINGADIVFNISEM